MSSSGPNLRVHLLVLATIGGVAVFLIVVYFLRRILAIVEAYHHVYVLAFLGLFAIWCYWIVFALIRRRVAGEEEASQPTGAQGDRPETD